MNPLLLSILCVSATIVSDFTHAERSYGKLCLALVGFTEARSESDVCLAETMHVVLERLKYQQERWGYSICDVVHKKAQFSGVEKLPYPRQPDRIEPEQWQRALDMADKVIERTAPRDPACLGATHFDQGGGEGKEVLCRCGAHTFSIEKTNVEMVRK